MGPKPNHKPQAPVTKSHAAPNPSGHKAIVEKPSPKPVELSAQAVPMPPDVAPPIEVRVLSSGEKTSAVYEIWTEHNVFEFNQSLCCIAVRDADTGEPKVPHACVGARLIGGRLTEDQSVDISSPLPAIGHKALLGGDGYALTLTTPVTRVVMNLWRWSSSPPPPPEG